MAVGGGWRLAVGGPWGLPLRAVLNKTKSGFLKTAVLPWFDARPPMSTAGAHPVRRALRRAGGGGGGSMHPNPLTLDLGREVHGPAPSEFKNTAFWVRVTFGARGGQSR